MTEPRALINAFYTAFAQRDWAAMGACYHPEVHFTDPLFDLHGDQARLMWRMLCTRAKDFQLEFRDVEADASTGKAHWEARYIFSGTGRKVHNIIDAHFTFREGLILRHEDQFDFARWSRQALGLPGLLLGKTGFLKNKVRAQTSAALAAFKA
jgi:ketosteroid isomerase-like protein